MTSSRSPRTIAADFARRYLVSQLGLAQPRPETGPDAALPVLRALRCIQLDPLDRIGTNADLVLAARADGTRRGDVYGALFPTLAFEHFAKERCLLPADAFPYYRDQAAATPWWRNSERLKRLDAGLIESVLAEVAERGPVAASDLQGYGAVKPLDWSGWKGTARAASLALEVLWTQCRVVVAGRTSRGKLYDIPARALPDVAHATPAGPFAEWAIAERVEAAGLLSHAGGAQWSMLSDARGRGVPSAMAKLGLLEEVAVDGARRHFWAPPGFAERAIDEPDDRMRVIGPLDPLIWDRKLVQHIFGFEYVWEVYKPAAQRRWGYYVCPLLHRGALVGRLEAHREQDNTTGQARIVVDRVWREAGVGPRAFDSRAFDDAIDRLALAQ